MELSSVNHRKPDPFVAHALLQFRCLLFCVFQHSGFPFPAVSEDFTADRLFALPKRRQANGPAGHQARWREHVACADTLFQAEGGGTNTRK